MTDILTCISMVNTSESLNAGTFFNFHYSNFCKQFKFHAQMSFVVCYRDVLKGQAGVKQQTTFSRDYQPKS